MNLRVQLEPSGLCRLGSKTNCCKESFSIFFLLLDLIYCN